MPPKRKTAEPASTPEPKRRVTRSSTKKTSTPTHDIPNDSPKAEQKALKKRSVPKPKKLSPENAKPRADEQADEDSSSTPTNVITLTITHDLVKKPIQCHQYTPPSPPSSPSTTLIFTHGAGGTLSADAVVNFCSGFSTSLPVLAFKGSMNLKARTKGFHACIDELDLDQKNGGMEKRLLLGGRSMGARAAVIATSELLAEQDNEEEDMSAQLVLVSYPLQGPKDDLRDQILLDLPKSVSVLFIIGDKDTMCPLDLLNETRSKMSAKSQLVVVRSADHGIHVKPASVTKEVGEETGRMAARWVKGGLEEDVLYIGEEED